MALTSAQIKYYEETCKRFYNGSYKNIGNLLEPQESEEKKKMITIEETIIFYEITNIAQTVKNNKIIQEPYCVECNEFVPIEHPTLFTNLCEKHHIEKHGVTFKELIAND